MPERDIEDDAKTERASKRFTRYLCAGVVSGIAIGLFFGEEVAWLKWVADGFVGLLQMSVLPYVAVSLVANLGRMSSRESGRLAKISVCMLLALWAVGLVMLGLVQFCFPPWDGGSFFSTSIVSEPKSMNWVEWFIPANLFFSLSNNLVPAVVLFSIGFGVAIRTVPKRSLLLEQLDVVVEALSRLNKLVVRFSPIGVFAIVAHAAGTLSLKEFGLLQGYLLAYAAAALLLSCWILPVVISCCTPLSVTDVLRESRDLLIAAFIIGNTFAVLPLIIEAVERLTVRAKEQSGDASDSTEHTTSPGYTVQLAYPFPDVGRIIGLLFIPFAAWFYGTQIEPSQIVPLTGAGVLASFGKLIVAIPMLLDMAEIPTDIFSLFLAIGVVAGRLGDLMKSMHLLTFSVLTASLLYGTFRLNVRRIVSHGAISALLIGGSVVGIRSYLQHSFQDHYSREDLLIDRSLLADPGVFTILDESSPNPDPLLPGEDPLDRILRRGQLRIGFDPDKLPFSYVNRRGDLIGYDIEMAHQLGRDLGVAIEFVPFQGKIIEGLREDRFDIAMSGLEGTVTRSIALPRMESYLVVTRSVVVPDHLRKLFRSLGDAASTLEEDEIITLAVVRGSVASENVADRERGSGLGSGAAVIERAGLLPHLDFIEVQTAREFFESDPPLADGLIVNAEEGASWTLKYPQFTVVRPKGFTAETPLHYFVANESRLHEFLNSWLIIKQLDGTRDQLYDYWILGNDSKARRPRWSIKRDVLGWTE